MDKPGTSTFWLCLLALFAFISARKWVSTIDEQAEESGKFSLKAGKSLHRAGDDAIEDITLEAINAGMTEAMKICNESYPIPTEYFAEYNETGQLPTTATRDIKCYLNCFFMKVKLLDDKGNINMNTVRSILTSSEEGDLTKMNSFKKCFDLKTTNGSDPCEGNFEKILCLSKGMFDYKNANQQQQQQQ